MDKLDRSSVVVILILIVALTLISIEYRSEARDNSVYMKERAVVSIGISPDQLDAVKDLIASNNIDKAEKVVIEMIGKYPYEGGPHMLKGDIMMRKQDPVSAVHSFRSAVELEPDYVDKKTPLFQGRKIRSAVEEAKTLIDDALEKDPLNMDMKLARKTIYYLLRSLAGSCG